MTHPMSVLLLSFIFQQFIPIVQQHPYPYVIPHNHIAEEMVSYRETMGKELKNVDEQKLRPKWKKEFDHLKEVHHEMYTTVPNVNRFLMGFYYGDVIDIIKQMKLATNTGKILISPMTHNEKKVMEMTNDLIGFTEKIEKELTAVQNSRDVAKWEKNLSPASNNKVKVEEVEVEVEEKKDNKQNHSPRNNEQDDSGHAHDHGQSSYTFFHPSNIFNIY